MTPLPTLSLIVAMGENRVIGVEGRLPWRLPADLKRFKQLTIGHTVIMGRKTYDSIARPLPHRRNIVVTRNRRWSAPGVETAHSLEEALTLAAGESEIFIIGGEQLYRAALPLADRIHLTCVHLSPEGDTFFPEFSSPPWRVTEQEHLGAGPRGGTIVHLPAV